MVHFFTSLESRVKLLRHADRCPIAWIASWPGRPCSQEECAKSAKLDAITPRQCSRDLVKNGIDDLLRVLEMQVRILFCQAPNQSRFEHEPLPSQKGSQARAIVVKAPKNPASGAIQGLHAASGPAVLTTYEATIKDEAGYTAALPEVEKYIKNNGGQRLAGGFNKAKLIDGTGAVGNRYVIVSWPNAAAFEKAQSDGLKAWIDKHGNGARQIMVEGVEAK